MSVSMVPVHSQLSILRGLVDDIDGVAARVSNGKTPSVSVDYVWLYRGRFGNEVLNDTACVTVDSLDEHGDPMFLCTSVREEYRSEVMSRGEVADFLRGLCQEISWA